MNEKPARLSDKKLRVLIVDDSAQIRSMLTRLCVGFPNLEVVGEAQDGLEALSSIAQFKPDVITLDIRMPKLNGIEVLKAIGEEKPKPIVIVLTGITEEIYRQKCFELGANYVLTKGSEFEEIVGVLRRL